MKKIEISAYKKNDPHDMHGFIRDFPFQVEDAVAIGAKIRLPRLAKGTDTIVLTGLGGSAIGGDILRNLLADELKVPFIVNRDYSLPAFVGPKTLVIISSYSGNTEETISSYRDAIRKKAKVLCVTTGGTVATMAKRERHPLIITKPGYSPRAAVGYSVFPVLFALSAMGFVRSYKREIAETITLLKKSARLFSDPSEKKNGPARLAEEIHGKLPVIYSPTERYESVNIRWRGQIAENAKQLTFGHTIPEMNHNELVGWNYLRKMMKQTAVIFLRDGRTNSRVRLREEITQSIIAPFAWRIYDIHAQGRSDLARMLYLIHFGDWLSYYLSVLNGVDPTPVKVIDRLKSELSKVK